VNRGLLVLSVLLIILGIGSGLYFASLFGFILLFPAILPGRPRSNPIPVKTQPIPRRIAPPPQMLKVSSTPPSAPTPAYAPSTPLQLQTGAATFAPPLFPTNIFPTLSLSPPTAEAKTSAPEQKNDRDDLLEFGAILAIIRLALG